MCLPFSISLPVLVATGQLLVLRPLAQMVSLVVVAAVEEEALTQ
jgi:hypothetical protein